jgi:hypothetical protein
MSLFLTVCFGHYKKGGAAWLLFPLYKGGKGDLAERWMRSDHTPHLEDLGGRLFWTL